MKTMIDILKERLPEGLEVVKVKDKASASQAQITFAYKGLESGSWIYKTCAPGCEYKLCDSTIASVMMSFGIKLHDLEMAEYWKAKLLGEA